MGAKDVDCARMWWAAPVKIHASCSINPPSELSPLISSPPSLPLSPLELVPIHATECQHGCKHTCVSTQVTINLCHPFLSRGDLSASCNSTVFERAAEWSVIGLVFMPDCPFVPE